MNIFAVDASPTRAAAALGDKHVVKMVLETAQLLCSVFPESYPLEPPYKRTHVNHPCAVWARETFLNFSWLKEHGFALAQEYRFRYGKTHKSEAVIRWCNNHVAFAHLSLNPRTPFALAMPDEYKSDDPIESYRRYYNEEKRHLHQWTRREPPEWIRIAHRVRKPRAISHARANKRKRFLDV